jgi:hypothetical protein
MAMRIFIPHYWARFLVREERSWKPRSGCRDWTPEIFLLEIAT